MPDALLDLVGRLRSLPPEPDYEPQVDDMDEKEERKMRESDDLARGAVLRGTVQPGDTAQPCPQEGDVVRNLHVVATRCFTPTYKVVLHYAVRDAAGRCYAASEPAALPSASGMPLLATLGKGKHRLPRGWELALYEMRPGEIVRLQLKPEYGYAHRDCGIEAPASLPTDVDQHVDLQLVAVWRREEGCRALGDGRVYKHLHTESEQWETPREPYEVTVEAIVRAAPEDGLLGTGRALGPPVTLRFAVGDKAVPAALQTCVCSMSKGERASFWVEGTAFSGVREGPAASLPVVAQDVSCVELDLTLHAVIQVRDLRGDGSMRKRRLREGKGTFPMDCPLEDSRVRLHYRVLSVQGDVCYCDTRQQGEPVEFDTGTGAAPEAVDTCSRLMLVDEVATVTSDWVHTYKGRDDIPSGVPHGMPLMFEIELLGFDKEPSWVQSAADEKLRQAVAIKDQGNALFKEGAWKLAEQKYAKALRVLSAAGHEADSMDLAEAVSGQKVAVMLNLAAIGAKTQEHGQTITWCTKAIKEDPNVPKAYFRRGVAHGWLGHYGEAAGDLSAVMELDPSLKGEVMQELARMREREKKGEAQQRAEMTSFFDRVRGT